MRREGSSAGALRSELRHNHSPIRLTMVHLPGMNTPLFSWLRNKLVQRLQPLPPIYQPEVAARAIVNAAQQAPREVWLGGSTLQSIVGNMLFPDLLDRLLARPTGWRAQVTPEPESANRPDNLHQPLEEGHRGHGRFDHKAKS